MKKHVESMKEYVENMRKYVNIVAFCGEATSGKHVKTAIFLVMAEVVRRRDCCLSSSPNILERSGLRDNQF